LYVRKVTGDEVLDQLSDNSAMSLMGLRANATDNSENAGTKDFHILRRLMEDDGIPITKKNVDILLEAAGVNARYPKGGHKSTIGAIRNAILEAKEKSLRVFNTSKEEVKVWIANQPNFAKNKEAADGVLCYHKVLDEGFYYRYANDILRWTWKAFATGSKVRVCASSYAICEHQIEFVLCRVWLILSRTFLITLSTGTFLGLKNDFLMLEWRFDLPKVELAKLTFGSSIGFLKLKGETEAIRVDLKVKPNKKVRVSLPSFLCLMLIYTYGCRKGPHNQISLIKEK